MKFAKVLDSGAIQFVMETETAPPDHLGFIRVSHEVTAETHWVLNGSVVAYRTENYKSIPLYPCSWCPRTETWQDARSLAELTSAKLIEIQEERDRRINAPIEYAGVLVDADVASQVNITNKIKEIDLMLELGLAVPTESLFWRDANNQNKVFGSADEMKIWLQGLFATISQRTSVAYSWSWQMKNLTNASTDLAELSQVDW